jgi:hypothetical protein
MEQKESESRHNKCYKIKHKHRIGLFDGFWELVGESGLKFVKGVIYAIQLIKRSIESHVHLSKNLPYLVELAFSLDYYFQFI